MQLSHFDFALPPELIAQRPAPVRDESRLMHVGAGANGIGAFKEIGRWLAPGDLLVFNNTQVVKARLKGHKDSGGRAEALLERVLDERRALFQVRVSKPIAAGGVVCFGPHRATCRGRQGQFYELAFDVPVLSVLEAAGEVPLPPYISERADDDATRYQTVYASQPGAVAAPTAGLHFTDRLLAELAGSGVNTAELTLHVGAGTFQPIRGSVEEHAMHSEVYEVRENVAAQIDATRAAGHRVIAVGTTVVRTLESLALSWDGGAFPHGAGETQLFIRPGFEFRVVDSLITNFHLPQSTLLMLVCAFAGYDRVMGAYAQAVNEGLRFFSYGDAMWLDRAGSRD